MGDRESGLASWYGEPYHGRPTANGEIYDMNQLTAAHRTLPFDTIARVTHQHNRRSVEVRIIDRGPFVDGRIIDLSRAAADKIGMRREGVAPVEIFVLRVTPARWTIQCGAFQDPERARRLRDELARRHKAVRVVAPDASSPLHRVLAGSFTSKEEAETTARRIRQEDRHPTRVVPLEAR